MNRLRLSQRAALSLALFLSFSAPAFSQYDPLKEEEPGKAATGSTTTASKGEPKIIDFSLEDASRKRVLPLRAFLPAESKPAPVVLFSHGLGGSVDAAPYLGKHWASRGYLTIFMQHPGSDESVWKDLPLRDRMPAMQRAASGENLIHRIQDVKAILDAMSRWNSATEHPLYARMDLDKIGMAGHSFGAVTTQAVSGQAGVAGISGTDSRIKAAMPLSPSCPKLGEPARAFGAVKIPWLCVTGTKDIAPIGGADMASRLGVYPALPAGGKYELVLDGAEHSAFVGGGKERRITRRNPNHHKVMKAISTAFWDAHLRGVKEAKDWLEGPAAKAVLEEKDRFQFK